MHRIIPADARSTDLGARYSRRIQDHPRGCGEHKSLVVRIAWNPGSSLRMRGTLAGTHHVRAAPGIIPADAGNTPTSHLSARHMRDHPRGCGEHQSSVAFFQNSLGSSPRMRGAPIIWAAMYRILRIIPADAGSTSKPNRKHRSPEDHPRGCGEHRPRRRVPAAARGSSPRMRGAQTG